VFRVQVLETALRKLGAELRVGRAADPQRVPRAEDVVSKARLGERRSLDCATELAFGFEHADTPTAA
jgi:hypothetical protein